MAAMKKNIGATFAAATIAANLLTPVADAAVFDSPNFGSSNTIAVIETRSGVYKDYDIDVTPQTVDNAESSFKSAKETKSKKGKFVLNLFLLCYCLNLIFTLSNLLFPP